MSPHRLRAPSSDGAVLAEPSLSEAGAWLASNLSRSLAWDHDFQGRRATRLRAMTRHEVRALSHRFHERYGLDLPQRGPSATTERFIATGHQPELFHPGVWVKNFAVAAIAQAEQAVGLNLIVDNDIPKTAAIRVPTRTSEGLRARWVEFDAWAGEVPYEDWSVQDEARFGSFGPRVRETLGDLIASAMIEEFWPRVERVRSRSDRLGMRFALARREQEAAWGAHNWEVPLSLVCESESFLWFVSHILAHLPRFQTIHNEALARYRTVYRIRSRNHPVADLGRQGDWLESPFWVWRAQQPRRRPLLARQGAQSLDLRIAGEDDVLLSLPLGPDRDACCAVERLRDLPARRVRLRSRALTTTMFARLLLSDLFMHGIGGAKYDELGDEIIQAFFGIEPPRFLTLSMTLRPGIGLDPATPEQLRDVEHALRDVNFNPDRHLEGPIDAETARGIARKRQAIAGPTTSRRQRRARAAAIRACNEALQKAVASVRQRLVTERDRLSAGVRHNALARDREWSFIVHDRHRLHDALAAAAAPEERTG